MSETPLHKRAILEIAQYYDIPVFETLPNGGKVYDTRIIEAGKWANENLSDKSPDDIELFKVSLYKNYKVFRKVYPELEVFERVYELVFPPDYRPRMQEEYLPLMDKIKPQIEDKGLEDIEPKEFDLLTYLQEEQELKGNSRRYDILFKRYGIKGFAAQGKFKGEYCFDKVIASKQAEHVNWVDIYFNVKGDRQ